MKGFELKFRLIIILNRIKNWFVDLKRVFKYAPIIFHNQDWYYGYLLELERFKLSQMIEWWEKNDYGSSIDGKRRCLQMKIVVRLLDIISEKDNFYDIDLSKPLFDENNKYIGNTDNDYTLYVYINTRNYKRFIPWVTEESIKNNKKLWSIELRKEKAWNLYNKIRERHIRDWWD